MLNSRVNRSTVGSTSNQMKSKIGSKSVAVIAAMVALFWCIFIGISFHVKFDLNQLVQLTPNDSNTSISATGTIVRSPELKLESNQPVHVVFSTDCSFFQDWQTILIFHSAIAVAQEGKITRIASGCSDEKQASLRNLYAKLFPMYDVHFTPDFKLDKKTNKKYDFYNKPHGVNHWLSNAVPVIESGTVIAIIDPDMIFLRPLTVNVRESNMLLLRDATNVPNIVEKGSPVSQLYGIGAPWATKFPSIDFDRRHVCGANSPCLNVTQSDGKRQYSVGPPYLVEKSDLVRLARSWVDMVPRVYERYPDLLAEMYAYSMGAAHENLPHFTVTHYMISNTIADDEGWKWIDNLKNDVCLPSIAFGDPGEELKLTGIIRKKYYPSKPLPTFLHYCQFYRAGELGFQKRRIREDIFDCDFPLFEVPPSDLGTVKYKNRDGEIMKISRKEARRNAFALHVIHNSMNDMLTFYKTKMCLPGNISKNKTLNAIHWPSY